MTAYKSNILYIAFRMYYKRAGMRNKRFVIQSKHATLFNKFKHSLQTKTCCYRKESSRWIYGLNSPATSSLHKYREMREIRAKLGRINEIISAAESLLLRVRRGMRAFSIH